jgi:predicted SPOUT superfamily RNA methylase MTH1
METPQYLRRYLFPKMPELKYAGVLPPLRTPHHPLKKKIADLEDGEWREGVVIRTGAETLVDIGVEHPISLNGRSPPLWQRITVRIHKNGNTVKLKRSVEPHMKKMYWGYRVNVSSFSLGKMLRSGAFDLIMLTSRYGKPLTEALGELKSRWKKAKNKLIAFGSPKQGLRDILAREGLKMGDFNALVVNTIPAQGVKTVRTEEAIYASLSILNVIS